jgi:hypothetical protein
MSDRKTKSNRPLSSGGPRRTLPIPAVSTYSKLNDDLKKKRPKTSINRPELMKQSSPDYDCFGDDTDDDQVLKSDSIIQQ